MKRFRFLQRQSRSQIPPVLLLCAVGLASLAQGGLKPEPGSAGAVAEIAPRPKVAIPAVDHLKLELALARLQAQLQSWEQAGPSAERALKHALMALGQVDPQAMSVEVAGFVARSFPVEGERLLALLRCYGGYAAGLERLPSASAIDPATALISR